MVESRGEFFPFAATVAPAGKVNIIQPVIPGDESAATWTETLIGLTKASIEEEGACAAALCFNGRVTPAGKNAQAAILIDVEDTDGESLQIVHPYKKKMLFKGYSYGEIMGQPLERKLFR